MPGDAAAAAASEALNKRSVVAAAAAHTLDSVGELEDGTPRADVASCELFLSLSSGTASHTPLDDVGAAAAACYAGGF